MPATNETFPAAESIQGGPVVIASPDRIGVELEHVRNFFVSEPIDTPNGGFAIFAADSSGGMQKHTFDPLTPLISPAIAAKQTVNDPASFIEYVELFKGNGTVAFASTGSRSITANLDYHMAADAAGRDKHSVTLQCDLDPDYTTWRAAFDKLYAQERFADFLEDMLHTIARPAAADLLDAIRHVEIDRAIKVKSKIRQQDGTVQINYEEIDGQAQGHFILPQQVIIVVPVFNGTSPVTITANLRYVMEKGVIMFKLVVPGLTKIERDEFRKIGEEIAASNEIPVFYKP